MPARKRPRYLLHKPSGQARVILNGKHHYLGAYDSLESHQRYEQLIAEWILPDGDLTKFDLSVSELCLLSVEHAVQHFRRKDDSATGTIRNVREAPRYLLDLFGKTRQSTWLSVCSGAGRR